MRDYSSTEYRIAHFFMPGLLLSELDQVDMLVHRPTVNQSVLEPGPPRTASIADAGENTRSPPATDHRPTSQKVVHAAGRWFVDHVWNLTDDIRSSKIHESWWSIPGSSPSDWVLISHGELRRQSCISASKHLPSSWMKQLKLVARPGKHQTRAALKTPSAESD